MLDTILRCWPSQPAASLSLRLMKSQRHWSGGVIRDEANSVLGPRSTALDAERKQLSEELQSEPPAPKEVALHPAILKR